MVGQMRFRPFQWSQLDKLTTQLSDNPEDLIETDGCATQTGVVENGDGLVHGKFNISSALPSIAAGSKSKRGIIN